MYELYYSSALAKKVRQIGRCVCHTDALRAVRGAHVGLFQRLSLSEVGKQRLFEPPLPHLHVHG